MRLLVIIGLLFITACDRAPPPAPLDQSIRPAKLFRVSAIDSISKHTFVGRVEAAQTIDMSFQIPGQLAELPVLEGQSILKGALVAALDPADYRLALREAQVQLNIAKQDYNRKLSLLTERGISQSLVDDARALYQLRQVHLAQAKENLSDARIRAPFDAYVSKRFIDNHVNVAARQPIVRLHDLTRLHIVTSIPETILATVTTEQIKGLFAHFSSISEERFELTVHENSGEAGSVAQTYEVTLAMAPPEQWTILPGMTATVEVLLASAESATSIYIPTSAVVSGEDEKLYVWLFEPETLLVRRTEIIAGTMDQRGVPVISGIEVGDLIISAGAGQLIPGMKVRPLGEPESF